MVEEVGNGLTQEHPVESEDDRPVSAIVTITSTFPFAVSMYSLIVCRQRIGA